MNITIYHNPACGTSRNTLALIRNTGVEPTAIDYLNNPPSRETLQQLITDAGLTVRQAIRETGTSYQALGLDDNARMMPLRMVSGREINPMFMLGALLAAVSVVQTFRGKILVPSLSGFWYAMAAFRQSDQAR